VNGGCFIHGHAADGVFGHGVRLFHGSLSFLSCCSARRPTVRAFALARTTCLSPFSSCVAFWDLATVAINALGVPTPLATVRCFRRAATPPHGLSEIPQGRSCVFRDKAYMRDGHLALLPASTTLRKLRKCSATPFACTVAASPSSSGRRWCQPCTSKEAANRCVR
jgi:hypothetical protein